MNKPKKLYRVEVMYPANLYPAMDDKIYNAAGKYSDSSGCGFGGRDMCFNDLTQKEANQMAQAISKISDEIGAEVLEEIEED